MKTVQLKKTATTDWEYLSDQISLKKPLVFVFGNRYMLESETILEEVKSLFSDGEFVFGSTSGDITSQYVDDESVTITAIEFEKSQFIIKTANVLASNAEIDSYKTGKNLIEQFRSKGLKHEEITTTFKLIDCYIYKCAK